MGRRKLNREAKSDHPDFWRMWLQEARKLPEDDGFLYGWLPETMTEGEIGALKIAAKSLNMRVVLTKRGGGEVYDNEVSK